MERRLLKDFQIGLVEGLIQDAISSNEKGPKDVFSKIAKAIGRRTSQGSKKKDWNAVVRQKSLARDPIGSTAEGAERRHRQSVRRYILDHQKDSLLSMDTERLVEYNPLLAEIAPAARVAYAKFKIPKIKQEYEENTIGQDEVFENVPTVDIVDETKKSSIVRPRPKSTKQSPVAGALPYPSTSADKQPTESVSKPAVESQQQTKTIQKTKTTELKDSAPASVVSEAAESPAGTQKKEQEQKKSEPGTSKEPTKDADSKSQASTSGSGPKEVPKETKTSHGDEESKKKDTDSTKDADKASDNASKDTDKSKDKDKPGEKDKDSKHLKPESPKRSASPKKPGGKSKVTGEILTGWL